MSTTLQLNLRGIFTPNDSENLTSSAGDIFSNITSTINNFFQYLVNLFNEKFPPEDRDEQIHSWFHGAKPYLIGAVVLITCLCFWSCLFSCISGIVVGCFNIVWSLFSCIFGIVMSLFQCVGRCLCCGGRSVGKMMKAPGRSSMKLSRPTFEGNPRGYFRDLRGQPNDFGY